MLLGDEALDTLGEQGVGVRNAPVRSGAGEEEELLVLQPLAG